MTENAELLITDVNAHHFFQDAIETALQHQKVEISGETTVYLGNLLTTFINCDYLYDQTPEGRMIKPLAIHYQEALDARSGKERFRLLKRLGDISLFISGLFARSLSRSLVDIDYYIAMGGNAYGYLSETGSSRYLPGLKIAFSELSERFPAMMDILSEVGESTSLNSNNDVLRLYEIWLRTGSHRVAAKLGELGIHPVSSGQYQH